MHKKQRGKQHNFNTNIIHSPIKIKILLAYLEKILYLWAVGECGGKEKKLALGKRRAQDTNTAEYRRKSGHLCWMASNPMNDVLNQNTISGNERRWDVGILFRCNRQSYAD